MKVFCVHQIHVNDWNYSDDHVKTRVLSTEKKAKRFLHLASVMAGYTYNKQPCAVSTHPICSIYHMLFIEESTFI